MMKRNKRKPQGATRTNVEVKPQRRPLGELLHGPLKALRVLVVCALVVGLFVGGQRLLDGLDQPITRVEVVGDLTHINDQAIAEWVQQQITEGVLLTDLHNLQVQLQARPWVDRVAVRRKWPGILRVQLEEHKAVARWNEKALLTAEGVVFQPEALPEMAGAPHLKGSNSSARAVLDHFSKLQAELTDLNLRVVSVAKSERGAWLATLLADDSSDQASAVEIELALGKQQLAARLARFKSLYHSVLKARLNEIERVDLRYTNGVAVQWKPATAVS